MELKSDGDDNNQSINFFVTVLATLLTSLDNCLSSGQMISSLVDLNLVRVFQRRSHPDFVLPGLHLRLENLLENLGGVEVRLH